ncbi:MAG: hypothetical protein J5780_03765 [Treponema sp.]|nr:hypothetical protein [Treponema sp.]
MKEDLKNIIRAKQGSQGFIKVTDLPVENLSDAQKVMLNRKANTLFNEGKINEAERIFITTGYSDGLSRTGDFYMKKNEYLKALRLYTLAHNSRKLNPLVEKISEAVSFVLKNQR